MLPVAVLSPRRYESVPIGAERESCLRNSSSPIGLLFLLRGITLHMLPVAVLSPRRYESVPMGAERESCLRNSSSPNGLLFVLRNMNNAVILLFLPISWPFPLFYVNLHGSNN